MADEVQKSEVQKDDLDRMQFLYERRMNLYNFRRDHEWKIFFGAITLLIALDATQLIYRIELEGWKRLAWLCFIAVPAIACYWYEWALQHRNFFDRRAMNELYNRICGAISIPEDSPIRESAYSRWAGLWAFMPQTLVLLTVFSISAVLPWLGIKLSVPPK
jgi:hypothetical protein